LPPEQINRREFLNSGLRSACILCAGGTVGYLAATGRADNTVWQIDPNKCIQCGRCATECVLSPSAVKCVHSFTICGYCLRCFAYFDPQTNDFTSAAENQMCPTGAITRRYIEEPYYEYTFDEELCIGCGKCVKGCATFGNGSIYLQVRHDRCLNCNQCDIALQCPADAFVRVPSDRPYLLKKPDASE
jgi:electron transport complex protein RnfB